MKQTNDFEQEFIKEQENNIKALETKLKEQEVKLERMKQYILGYLSLRTDWYSEMWIHFKESIRWAFHTYYDISYDILDDYEKAKEVITIDLIDDFKYNHIDEFFNYLFRKDLTSGKYVCEEGIRLDYYRERSVGIELQEIVEALKDHIESDHFGSGLTRYVNMTFGVEVKWVLSSSADF